VDWRIFGPANPGVLLFLFMARGCGSVAGALGSMRIWFSLAGRGVSLFQGVSGQRVRGRGAKRPRGHRHVKQDNWNDSHHHHHHVQTTRRNRISRRTFVGSWSLPSRQADRYRRKSPSPAGVIYGGRLNVSKKGVVQGQRWGERACPSMSPTIHPSGCVFLGVRVYRGRCEVAMFGDGEGGTLGPIRPPMSLLDSY
jgi:hypothetical protein